MRGVITRRDVLANLRLIWREYGSRCVLRCFMAVFSSRPTTFLDGLLLAPLDARPAKRSARPERSEAESRGRQLSPSTPCLRRYARAERVQRSRGSPTVALDSAPAALRLSRA